jgi:hypothetical protein
MAIEPARRSGTHFDPVGDLFTSNLVLADFTIKVGKEPSWLRKNFGQEQDIRQSYGLECFVLRRLALALDLSLGGTPVAAVTKIREKVVATQHQLIKARASMLELSELVRLPPLQPKCLKLCKLADGSVELDYEPDPTDVTVEAIDKYVKRLSEVKIPLRKGRWPSLVRHAVARLEQIAERENPSLTRDQLKALCELSFDQVQKRHGRRSRSPLREQDETPGYSHLLKKRK